MLNVCVWFYTGEREINDLKVKCANSINGCEWNGALAGLKKHLSLCNQELVTCPNKCKENSEVTQIHRKDLKAHLKDNCPNRSYECPHCKQEGKHHDITTSHLERCHKVAITCPNKDCWEIFDRCDITEHLLECPFHMVPCKYIKIGCEEKQLRREVEDHEKRTDCHFHLAMETIHQMHKDSEKRFIMTGFDLLKEIHESFYSLPFYAYSGGCKITVRVDADDDFSDEHTNVSVFVYFMKGKFDDKITWPFTGSVTVELLNQLEDRNHHQRTIKFQKGQNDGRNRRVVGERSKEFGFPLFISHEALRYNAATNCQYLKDDCLYFRVAVTPDRVKPWLTPTV